MNEPVVDEYSFLSHKDKITLSEYLIQRFSSDHAGDRIFNVVFDLLHNCNLNCVGCGTNAHCICYEDAQESYQLDTKSVLLILDKLKEYSRQNGIKVFVNFGGGEPFLREDIIQIIKYAAQLFGYDGVGIDTNASLSDSFTLIKDAAPYLSYIGISINGLQDYHNWWANRAGFDAFCNTFSTVEALCNEPDLSAKIEVTSVATKKNIKTLPTLMQVLSKIGVKNYSVHRAISVGRMAKLNADMIPSWKDYLWLLLSIIKMADKLGMNAHVHHSIEGIHATLLCGMDTMSRNKKFDKNFRSSVGIDSSGNLLINPWCIGDHWSTLSLGNILEDNRTIAELQQQMNGVMKKYEKCFLPKYRCFGCTMPCSGGSRIAAAAAWFNANHQNGQDLETALQAIDPACPLTGLE